MRLATLGSFAAVFASVCVGASSTGYTMKLFQKMADAHEQRHRLNEALFSLENPGYFRTPNGSRHYEVTSSGKSRLLGRVDTVVKHLENGGSKDDSREAAALRTFLPAIVTLFEDFETGRETGYQTWSPRLVEILKRISKLDLPQTSRVLNRVLVSEAWRAADDLSENSTSEDGDDSYSRPVFTSSSAPTSLESAIAGTFGVPDPSYKTKESRPQGLYFRWKRANDPTVLWLAEKFPRILSEPLEALWDKRNNEVVTPTGRGEKTALGAPF